MCDFIRSLEGNEALAIGTVFDSLAVGAQAASAKKKSQATKDVHQYRAGLALRQAEVEDLLAADEITLGVQQKHILGQQRRALRGKQRVAAGASGIQANFGSPVHVMVSTDNITLMDEAVIMDNAVRRAFGRKVRAADLRSEAVFESSVAANEDPDFAERMTLITGAGKVASNFLNRTPVLKGR